MKVKVKKYLMLLVLAVGMLFSTAVPVSAYTGGAQQQTSETGAGNGNTVEAPITEESSTEESDNEETAGRVQGTPFSVPGNGQLVDDVSDDETKQFLTIQTKNGNTFFMVLDRSSNAENVYMLSMIDENDLAEFLEEPQAEPEPETPSVVIPEQEAVRTEPETEPEAEPVKEEKGGMNVGALLAVAVLLAGGAGGYYYFKVLKPQRDEDDAEGEDLEFYDGGAYINEDQEDTGDDDDEE